MPEWNTIPARDLRPGDYITDTGVVRELERKGKTNGHVIVLFEEEADYKTARYEANSLLEVYR